MLDSLLSAKYLGITISDDLSWSTHIDNIIKSANQTLGFLKRGQCNPWTKSLGPLDLGLIKLDFTGVILGPVTCWTKLTWVLWVPKQKLIISFG